MKHLEETPVVLLLSLAFFLTHSKGEDNITDVRPENYSQRSTENEMTVTVLSEDDVILEKWRTMERLLKTTASKAVKEALPSILRFSEEIDISPKCSKSIMKMIYGFKDMKVWAYRMLDASGKIASGIMTGTFSSLGDFDGCLSVEVPGSHPFRGQYCAVFIKPAVPEWKPFHKSNEVLPLFINFTKKETVVSYMAKIAHHSFYVYPRTSICVPSTCSLEDIRSIVDTATTVTGLPLNLSISTCDVIGPVVFSKGDVAIICLLSVIFLVALVATVTDVVLNIIGKEQRSKMETSSTAVKCLMCFSTYTNTLRLLKKDDSPDSIKIFHGFKFITLTWVILNHTYYYQNFSLLGTSTNAIEMGKEVAFQLIANGFLNVDTFFFISSVLVAYGRMKFTGKHISIPLYIFRRVWRLTPPMMLIIATSILVPHMGSGPAWKETIGPLIDRCKANWWTNLVFINNFLSSDNMCFQWLWYIPVDVHLYLLALFVIVPLKSRPRLAHGMNILLFICGTIFTAAGHVYYKHHPIALLVFSHPTDRHYFIDNSYFRSYTHITTCSIGLYVGYVLATRPKLRIPKIVNIFGWLSSLAMALLVLYGVYDWNQGNIPGMLLSTVYSCTAKVVWALALGYVTIACCSGNGGVITSFLGWQGFVPLSRLTYVTYMIHPILHFMYFGSSRVLIQCDHKTTVYIFLANMVASYSFAYVISLLFESPFMCLEKVMFSRKRTAKSTERSKPEVNGAFENHIKDFESSVATINLRKIEDEEPSDNRFIYENSQISSNKAQNCV